MDEKPGNGDRVQGWFDGQSYTGRVIAIWPEQQPGWHDLLVREDDGTLHRTFSDAVTLISSARLTRAVSPA
jgi:hypothetical protein